MEKFMGKFNSGLVGEGKSKREGERETEREKEKESLWMTTV